MRFFFLITWTGGLARRPWPVHFAANANDITSRTFAGLETWSSSTAWRSVTCGSFPRSLTPGPRPRWMADGGERKGPVHAENHPTIPQLSPEPPNQMVADAVPVQVTYGRKKKKSNLWLWMARRRLCRTKSCDGLNATTPWPGDIYRRSHTHTHSR